MSDNQSTANPISNPIKILIISVFVILISRTVADPDLWGHLRFGLDILHSSSLAQFDPYSYLSSMQPWINHEWLAEVLFAFAWTIGGTIGLILLKTTLGFAIFYLAYLYLIKIQDSIVRGSILLLLSYFLLFPFIRHVRPQLFTILLFELILLVIIQAEQGKYIWLWAAPIIMVLWVNLHGGVLAGLGILIIWAAIHLFLNLRSWKRIIPPVLISIIACLINPYGLELMVFLLRTATVSRPEIGDWQPLKLISVLGIAYQVTLTLSILGWIFSRREKRIPLLILFVIISIMPMVAIRHLQMFALAFLLLAGEHILDAWSRISSSRQSTILSSKWIKFVPIIAALALLVWILPGNTKIYLPPLFPTGAVTLLKQSEVSGNLAGDFGWGEYVIWHLDPRIKVAMDGRRETVYSNTIYDKYKDFHFGTGEWDSILEDYETHMALVTVAQPSYNLLKMKPGWELVYEDSISALFANQDWHQFSIIKQTANNFSPPPILEYFP